MQFGAVNTALLEVIFGLAFLYAFLSTLCAAVVELLSAASNWRGVVLRDSLGQMLGKTPCTNFYGTLLIQGLRHETYTSKSKDKSDKDKYKRDPAYIPQHIFVLALLQILGEATPAKSDSSPETSDISPRSLNNFIIPYPASDSELEALRAVVALIASDINVTKCVTITEPPISPATTTTQTVNSWSAGTNDATVRLETWYGSVMERASGAYKRKTQIYLTVVALILCVGGNIDLFHAGRVFWVDTLTRGVLTTATKSTTVSVADAPKLKAVQTALDQAIPLPVGWSGPSRSLLCRINDASAQGTLWSKCIGVLLSIVALVLGAPFWFDVISKFYSLRSTGTPPKITDPSGFTGPSAATQTNPTPPVQNGLTVNNTPNGQGNAPVPTSFDAKMLSGDDRAKYDKLTIDQQKTFAAQADSIKFGSASDDDKKLFLLTVWDKFS